MNPEATRTVASPDISGSLAIPGDVIGMRFGRSARGCPSRHNPDGILDGFQGPNSHVPNLLVQFASLRAGRFAGRRHGFE